MVVRVSEAIIHSKRQHNEAPGGGGGGGSRNLKYVGLGVRTSCPLAPRIRKKKPNAGWRLPRMGDARAGTEEQYPQSG